MMSHIIATIDGNCWNDEAITLDGGHVRIHSGSQILNSSVVLDVSLADSGRENKKSGEVVR